jgi:peptide/nickel transport system permease protein
MLVFATFCSYAAMRSIGTPQEIAQGLLGFNYTERGAAQLIEDLKLDRSLLVGYVEWAWNALQGDFGTSYAYRNPVGRILWPTLPVTFQLMAMAVMLSLAISMPIAILSAYRPGSRFDRIASAGAFGFLSLPEYVFGIFVIFFVALGTRIGGVTIIPDGIFPAGTHVPVTENPRQSIRHLFLPALTVAISQTANFMRILRTDMLATLQEDYILLAKSKGLSDRHILLRHALRPSSFTFVTITGLNIGSLIGTSTIVEQLFTLNGTGSALIRSVGVRDMPMVLGAVAIITAVYVATTATVDVLYGVIDPRVRRLRALG